MTEAVVDGVMYIVEEGRPINLHMVEIMTMQQKMGTYSRFVNGIVLDHGTRNLVMPNSLTNYHIMTCNVNFE